MISFWLKFDKVLYRSTLIIQFEVSREKTDHHIEKSWEGRSYDKTLVICVGEEGKMPSYGRKTKRKFCDMDR